MIKERIFRLLLLCIISVVLAETESEPVPEDVLTAVMNRMKNTDQTYIIDMIQSQKGKPDIRRKFKTLISQPPSGEVERYIRIEYLFPEDMKGVIFWEHRFADGTKKRWRTMPITGKLKKLDGISDRKLNKNGFSFSDLEITPESISTHTHRFLGYDTLFDRRMIVLESVENDPSRKKPSRKKLWVDEEWNMLRKVIFYNSRGREERVITGDKVIQVDGIPVIQHITVDDLRKKLHIGVEISELTLGPITDQSLFIPRGK